MAQTSTNTPIERVLDLLPDAKGPKGADNYYTCKCPAHDDKNPSLLVKAIGDEHDKDGEGVVLKCFAGCSRQAILDALNLDEKELHYRSEPVSRSGSTTKRTPPVTASDLGVDKLIHPNELLTKYHVQDGTVTMRNKKGQTYQSKGVVIPYYTQGGNEYSRTRLRTALKAKDGSYWNDGDDPLIPYGLDKLEEARATKTLNLVEGESDCWTNWHYNIPTLGIPGISHYLTVKIEHLAGIERINILQEPPSEKDQAAGRDPGQKFVEDLHKHLREIGFTGQIYAVSLSEFDAKDPNDLHKQDPKSFKEKWERAIQQAHPADSTPGELASSSDTSVGEKIEIVLGRQLSEELEDILDVLYKANEPPQIFVRGGVLAHILADEGGRPRVEVMSERHLLTRIVAAANFFRYNEKSDKFVNAHPSAKHAGLIHSLGKWEFPHLMGIIRNPCCPTRRQYP